MKVEWTETGQLRFPAAIWQYLPGGTARAEVTPGELRIFPAGESDADAVRLRRLSAAGGWSLDIAHPLPSAMGANRAEACWDDRMGALRIRLGDGEERGFPDESLFAEISVEPYDGQWTISVKVYFSDGVRVHRVGRYYTEPKAQIAARIIRGAINRARGNMFEGW